MVYPNRRIILFDNKVWSLCWYWLYIGLDWCIHYLFKWEYSKWLLSIASKNKFGLWLKNCLIEGYNKGRKNRFQKDVDHRLCCYSNQQRCNLWPLQEPGQLRSSHRKWRYESIVQRCVKSKLSIHLRLAGVRERPSLHGHWRGAYCQRWLHLHRRVLDIGADAEGSLPQGDVDHFRNHSDQRAKHYRVWPYNKRRSYIWTFLEPVRQGRNHLEWSYADTVQRSGQSKLPSYSGPIDSRWPNLFKRRRRTQRQFHGWFFQRCLPDRSSNAEGLLLESYIWHLWKRSNTLICYQCVLWSRTELGSTV